MRGGGRDIIDMFGKTAHTIPYLTIPYLTIPYHTIPYPSYNTQVTYGVLNAMEPTWQEGGPAKAAPQTLHHFLPGDSRQTLLLHSTSFIQLVSTIKPLRFFCGNWRVVGGQVESNTARDSPTTTYYCTELLNRKMGKIKKEKIMKIRSSF